MFRVYEKRCRKKLRVRGDSVKLFETLFNDTLFFAPLGHNFIDKVGSPSNFDMVRGEKMLTPVKKRIAEKISADLVNGLKGAAKKDGTTFAETVLTVSAVMEQLEIPKHLDHGHWSYPVFPWAKSFRQSPALIAQNLADRLTQSDLMDQYMERIFAEGGYLNFVLKNSYIQMLLSQSLQSKTAQTLGSSLRGAGKKMVIDYGSPNMAKPMSIGHLRATVIGQAIRNLAVGQGYEVIGINHIGDWGSQFGKLAWAYQHWGHEYDFESKPFDSLLKLYVRFHEQAELDPRLNERGSETFKKLEQGDSEIKKIWQMFSDISLKDYQRLWDLLGVRHDLIRGESFYNDRILDVEQRLRQAGLLELSEGAWVVRLDEFHLPPCLIRKSDGSSIYATRDLASAFYRFEDLKADLNLYVVGVDQSLHFRQVFAVLHKLGLPWADQCHHISFGLYRFKDEGRMSTRKGNVILMEEVLDKAVALIGEVIAKKNPGLSDSAQIAQQVGVGAIIFNDLVNDRTSNVDFNWNQVVDFEGNSGPYVQYTLVRCKSIVRKYAKDIPVSMDFELQSVEERELMKALLFFDDFVEQAFSQYRPHILAKYMLEVCRFFNHFYQTHRILGSSPDLAGSRLFLVCYVQLVLEAGLSILNIQSPEAM